MSFDLALVVYFVLATNSNAHELGQAHAGDLALSSNVWHKARVSNAHWLCSIPAGENSIERATLIQASDFFCSHRCLVVS